MNEKKLLLLSLITCILSIRADEPLNENTYNSFTENSYQVDAALRPSSYEEAKEGAKGAKEGAKGAIEKLTQAIHYSAKWVADQFDKNQNDNTSQAPTEQLPLDQEVPTENQEMPTEILITDSKEEPIVELIPPKEEFNTKIDKNVITPSTHFNNTFGKRFVTGIMIDKGIRFIMPQASPTKKCLSSMLAQASTGFFLFDRHLKDIYDPINNPGIKRALFIHALKIGITYLSAHKFNDAVNVAAHKLATFTENR